MCGVIPRVATRQVGILFRHVSAHAVATILTTPTPYLLIAFGVVPLSLLQRGYQLGSPAVVSPPRRDLGET